MACTKRVQFNPYIVIYTRIACWSRNQNLPAGSVHVTTPQLVKPSGVRGCWRGHRPHSKWFIKKVFPQLFNWRCPTFGAIRTVILHTDSPSPYGFIRGRGQVCLKVNLNLTSHAGFVRQIHHHTRKNEERARVHRKPFSLSTPSVVSIFISCQWIGFEDECHCWKVLS